MNIDGKHENTNILNQQLKMNRPWYAILFSYFYNFVQFSFQILMGVGFTRFGAQVTWVMSAFIVLFVTNYVKSTSVFIIFLLFQILMGVAHVCLHRALCDNLNLLRLPRHLDHHLQTQQVRSGIFVVIVALFRNLAFYLLFFLEKRQLLEYSELLIPETFRINRGSLNS